jgi:L-iditol 2-dehydrogenase
MRAMWLLQPGQFDLRESPTPTAGPEEVLVQIGYCGICPWDVRVYSGKKSVPLPRVMGHEAAGTIVEVGPNVRGLEVGQRVMGDFIVKCGLCPNCRRGLSNRCLHPIFPKGGYADFAVLPAHNIHPIEKSSTSLMAAAFTEPLACVVRGQNMLRLRPGERQVVIGAGPIGLMHMQVAKLFGAQVMVADLIPRRLDLARELGADAIHDNSQGDLAQVVMDWTSGRGADAATVAVGVAPLVDQAVKFLGTGGRLNIFAGIYPVTPVQLDANLIHYQEIVVTGSSDSTPEDMHTALGHIEAGRVKVEPLVSDLLPLERLSEGFEIVMQANGLKVMAQVNRNMADGH